MTDYDLYTNSGFGLAQVPTLYTLSIVQHNCYGSCNVFLSLFNSLKTATSPPSFVLLQDPSVYRNRLPAFAGFKAFAPEIRNSVVPKVACYVFYGFLQTYPIVPLLFGSSNWMALDVHTLSGLFDSNHHVLRIYNGYWTNGSLFNIRTVAPEQMFPELDFLCLIAGDFNIDNLQIGRAHV